MSSTIFCSNETVTLERTVENTDHEIKLDEIWNAVELQRCTSWIKTHAFKNVCLQFSDELLTFSIKITAEIRENSESNVFILGDTSYGACCVDEIAASHIQADAIIHFGNACLSKVTRLPVLYVFHKFSFDTGVFLQNVETQITDRDTKLMVFYDVGYYYAINDAFVTLKKVFGKAQIGKLAIDGIEPNILCWSMDKSSTEDFTCIYIGNDNQSFFNISMGIKCQKWFLYNPRSRDLRETTVADSRWMRKRYFYIEKCKDAQSIGIVVGTLTTKGYLDMVHHIQEMAKSREVRSYMISVGKVNPAKLANFMDIDCFVLVGCPENTLYNSKEFYKPLVSVFEIEMAWNPAWKDQLPDTYCTDFTQLLPDGKLYKRDENAKFDENDISLVSGRVRHIVSYHIEKPENGCQQLQEMSKNQVAVTQAADVFNQRSWRGLDPELGKNDPAKIEQGRKGIAIRYEENPKPVDF